MRIGIIGGGIYGSAIAYFLQRFGADDVVLFEKGTAGGISTARSVGIVRHHYSNRNHVKIVKRAREILENLEDHVDRDGGFRNNGFVAVAGEENEAAFRDVVRLQQQVGLDVELLSPDELASSLPGLSPDDVTVGAIEHEAGCADPYQVATGFLQKAQELGADVRTNTEVVDIRTDEGEVTTVRTPTNEYQVDLLVNAAGPFGGHIARMVGCDLPISWHGATIAVLESSEEYSSNYPSLSDMDSGLYTKPEPNGRFVAGGFGRKDIADPRHGSGSVSGAELRHLSSLIEHRLPGYDDAQVVTTWTGVVTDTPDGYQILGPSTACENFYNAVAGNGHGFKEAAALAESIAQDILGRTPRFDLTPYRHERFAVGDEFVSRYSADWLG
ncbi:NAD(P)/FAD-dependent oxidoreductase [Haloarchaeobius sp. TZWWS8]|uniref:NAD(P)/FAD-dependent oxidoreductase n=1 Tax=Haloarchaeobius sp. TZWWS8 TaxID=3446121 RepID=UPI003EBAF4C8